MKNGFFFCLFWGGRGGGVEGGGGVGRRGFSQGGFGLGRFGWWLDAWIGGKKLMPLSFFFPYRKSALGEREGCSVPGVVGKRYGVKIDGSFAPFLRGT